VLQISTFIKRKVRQVTTNINDNMPALQHTITKRKCNLFQKQPSCKRVCSPQEGHCEKRYQIQGGGQDMAMIVG